MIVLLLAPFPAAGFAALVMRCVLGPGLNVHPTQGDT